MKSTYYKDRSKAVQWLRDRASKADWWTWVVLTQDNPDPENPKIDGVTARRIFEDLERQGLLEPAAIKLESNQTIGAYRLALSDEGKWNALAKPPGFIRKSTGWLWSRLNDPFPIAIVTGVFALLGAFIGGLAAAWYTKQ